MDSLIFGLELYNDAVKSDKKKKYLKNFIIDLLPIEVVRLSNGVSLTSLCNNN